MVATLFVGGMCMKNFDETAIEQPLPVNLQAFTWAISSAIEMQASGVPSDIHSGSAHHMVEVVGHKVQRCFTL